MTAKRAVLPSLLVALLLLVTACGGQPHGTQIISLRHQGQYRSYLLHLPPSPPEGELPLVVLLHDTGSNGDDLMQVSGIVQHADRHGYAVAAPNAFAKSFNDGSGAIGPVPLEVDDSGFIDAVIRDSVARSGRPGGPVYLVGMGSGGAMAQRATLELDAPVRATASIAGQPWIDPAHSNRATDMLLIFGTEDPLNPLAGGKVRYRRELSLTNPAVVDAARMWARAMACEEESWEQPAPRLDRVRWHACRDRGEVTLLIVTGLGHVWPGAIDGTAGALESNEHEGGATSPLDATALIWDHVTR